MADESIAPGLLIAMPDLLDPNFARSVVLMCAHSPEGAFGLIINRETEILVASVCSEADISWTDETERFALSGGPVERQRGWLVHSDAEMHLGSQHVAEGVALSASQEALEAYAQCPEGRFRLILGYAGWGPGQLDQEITEGAWLTAALDEELVFETPPDEIWARALASVGVNPTHLVGASSLIH